eukprot:207782-Amphidinium_carterae.1
MVLAMTHMATRAYARTAYLNTCAHLGVALNHPRIPIGDLKCVCVCVRFMLGLELLHSSSWMHVDFAS